MFEQHLILVDEQENIILDTPLLEPVTCMADGPMFCKVYEDVLVQAVLARFPGVLELLKSSIGNVELAADIVSKELIDNETLLSKVTQALKSIVSERDRLRSDRERLSNTAWRHAKTIGDYKRLKAIMEPDIAQSSCDVSSTTEAQIEQ